MTRIYICSAAAATTVSGVGHRESKRALSGFRLLRVAFIGYVLLSPANLGFSI